MVYKLEVQDILLAYRDGNSSLHLSRINKDLGLDLDSWTADSWLMRLEETQVIWYRNLYECISEGNWLSQNKFKWYFLFILSVYNAYKPPWGRSQHWLSHISFMNAKITQITQSVLIVQIRIRYHLKLQMGYFYFCIVIVTKQCVFLKFFK